MTCSATGEVLLLAFSVSTAGYCRKSEVGFLPKKGSGSQLDQNNAAVKARGRPTSPLAEVQHNLSSLP